ncbi:tRNA lysidine(34) synthetase TilS [Salinarimonas rosea]|uniref:tRNA lysidine(34) synthetase TilS n=1 Tax=Salinarimonas rosea TaxID=552063 RepID=UPI0004225EA1
MAAPDDAPLADAEADACLSPLLHDFRESGLILAVSGGPDSVALMRLAAPLARETGTPTRVVTIDHGLRPDSVEEAPRVARWAREAGLPHEIRAWDGEKPARGIQDAAREARYVLLSAAARAAGAGAILTAHHRDDQAETVLMRLCAGSGPAGLAGMRPRGDLDGLVLARPFLDLPKARLVATCMARGWGFVEDPSNASLRYARARLRRLAPQLADEGLGPARLAKLAARAARAEDALDAASIAAFARLATGQAPLVLDAAGLAAEPEEIALRVLSRAVRRVGGAAGYDRLSRLEAFWSRLAPAIAAGAPFRETLGGALATLEAGRLVVTPEPPRRGRRPLCAKRGGC